MVRSRQAKVGYLFRKAILIPESPARIDRDQITVCITVVIEHQQGRFQVADAFGGDLTRIDLQCPGTAVIFCSCIFYYHKQRKEISVARQQRSLASKYWGRVI